MSRITQLPTISLDVSIRLTAVEVQALEAIAGYGEDAFLKVFCEHLGEYYMKPHEAGIRSLFKTIRSELPPIINRLKNARTAFVLADPVIRSRENHNALIERVRAAATLAPPPTPSQEQS